jgi:Cu(I)/Ag(I) efflux system periplasmic protein CusF
VRRVDVAGGKVTLKHADIPNLDMPAMTMVFQVRDPAQLVQLKAGDKLRFTADKVNGAYTVIDLQVTP